MQFQTAQPATLDPAVFNGPLGVLLRRLLGGGQTPAGPNGLFTPQGSGPSSFGYAAGAAPPGASAGFSPASAPAAPASPFLGAPPGPGPDALAEGPGSGSGGGIDRITRILNGIVGPESGDNPNAVNRAGSSAKGRLQMIDGTWNDFLNSPANGGRFNGSHRFDRGAQDEAGRWYVGKIDETLSPVLGRPPSDPEVKASWMLGPVAMKAFLAAGPEADAFSTYASVTNPDTAARAFSQNGSILQRGATVGQTLANINRLYSGGPSGAAPGGGGGGAPSPSGAQEVDGSASMGPNSPGGPGGDEMATKALSGRGGGPKSFSPEEPGFFTPDNMLRLAAGFFSGKTPMESLGNATKTIVQGRQQDQTMAMQRELMDIRRRGADTDDRKANAAIMSEAAKIAEMTGVPLQAAIDIVGGTAPEGLRELLTRAQPSSGRRSQGELFLAQDGSYYRENQQARGGSIFTNLATGEDTRSLPRGAQAVNSAYLRAVQKDDGQSYAAAMTSRETNRVQAGHMNTLSQLLDSGQVSPGPGMMDRLKTAMAQNLGVGPDNPAAVQLAQNLIGKINQASYDKFKGLGPMSDADRMALERAGVNWMMDKNALQIALKYSMRNMKHEDDAVSAWENATDEEKVRGFRPFINRWKQNNALQPLDIMGALAAQQNQARPGPTDPNAFFR